MILSLALGYAFPHSRALRSRSIRIMLTIALSLSVVTLVISIMNCLQSTRFSLIRDVRSFDCVVEGDRKDEIKQILPSAVVFTYGEGEALTRGGAYLVRYIDSDYDGGLNMLFGDFSALVIPYSFYRKNGRGKTQLTMLRSGRSTVLPREAEYEQSGVYYTELGSEFDDTMLFLPLSEADPATKIRTAVKKAGSDGIRKLREKGFSVTSWKESEESLYGAFLVEKTLMYGVLSLLFIIIAVSMKSGEHVFYEARKKEFAELEILGMGRKRLRCLSLLSFMTVTLSGILLGFMLGMASIRILEEFSHSSSVIMSLTLTLPAGGFTFFSLFMVLMTVIFTHRENVRREKTEISEVIHG